MKTKSDRHTAELDFIATAGIIWATGAIAQLSLAGVVSWHRWMVLRDAAESWTDGQILIAYASIWGVTPLLMGALVWALGMWALSNAKGV
tara:strand:- start:51 stop:320 length:270 start_codon:yes stop_codon:yes gene_type:complete